MLFDLNDINHSAIAEVLKSWTTENHDTTKMEIFEILGKYHRNKSILGYDLYQYSRYPFLEQCLVPIVLKNIIDLTIIDCKRYETFVFQKYEIKDFSDIFIDTGDGGYFIFDNPLEALIFSIYMQANVQRFLSNKFPSLKNFSKYVHDIIFRYSITTDLVFKFDYNFYGSAIINNGRLLNKDRLNRLLIDNNSNEWFKSNFYGVENLQVLIYPDDFKKIDLFFSYKFQDNHSLIFETLNPNQSHIIKTDIQKIGTIVSKEAIMDCYSLHLQTYLNLQDENKLNKLVITLGNLNTTGLVD